MTIKIARMQNGEDVVANVKEVRANETDTQALAYEFENPFTVTLLQSATEMFDGQQDDVYGDAPPDPMDSLSDLRLQFFPWSPLSKGRNIVTLYSVVAMSDPHVNVMEGYHTALEKFKQLRQDDAQIDNTQVPPRDVYFGEGVGDGRGTEPND